MELLGITTAAKGAVSRGPSASRQFYAFTDCVNVSSTLADHDFGYAVSGTGAAFSGVASGTDNAIGIARASLGTVATNRAALWSVIATALQFDVLAQAICTARCRLVTLSTATNTYTLRAGFIDSVTAESTDGVFFRYTHSVNSGRWQLVARANNVETAVDTGVTATANGWVDLEVRIENGVAYGRINGGTAVSISTNIPSGSGRETGYGVMALRSAGTTSLNAFDIDFLEVIANFATAR